MTIAEIIENITDRAVFEKIVIDILRDKEPLYWNTIHEGINSKGETITSPLDAFHKLPNGDFVLFEVTTTDIKDLKNKWLNSKNGDLIKAGKKADTLRQNYPNSKFIVWLCTNSRIKDDSNNAIITETEKKASELNISIKYLEQSAIAAYLENNITGQWIAENYLGIKAVRLSFPKLLQLADRINLDYKVEISYDENKIIDREIRFKCLQQLKNSEKNIQIIIGRSGNGKSTIAFQLTQYFSNKSIASFKINSQYIDSSISLIDAISKQLKEYQENIRIDDLFNNNNIELIIVIEDINREKEPLKLLEKILKWNTDKRYKIIIPIWDTLYAQLSDLYKNNKNKIFEEIYIDRFSKKEAHETIKGNLKVRGIELIPSQIEAIAEELSFDPFLINMYLNLPDLNSDNWFHSTKNPIRIFFDDEIQKVENSSQYLHYQIYNALKCISEKILVHKTFIISLQSNSSWFDSETINIIHAIGNHSNILSIARNSYINFKHDKIRDYLLISKIQELIREGQILDDIFKEPYYAELIAKAIGSIENLNNFSFVLDRLLEDLPLSIFESLHHSIKKDNIDLLNDKLVTWLPNNINKLNEATLQSIEWKLADIEYQDIHEITKFFNPNRFVFIANFRNGDTLSGAKYLSIFKDDFEPSYINSERDRLIENFILRYKNKGIGDLKVLLKNDKASIVQKNTTILLAGYLKSYELFDSVFECWQTDKEELLCSSIWALINCINDSFESKFLTIFDYWMSLPNVERGNSFPQGTKNLTTYYLSRAKLDIQNEKFIRFLLSFDDLHKNSNLCWILLANIDYPDVFEYVVEKLGAAEKDVTENGGINFALWKYPENWTPSANRGKQISKESLIRLWNICQNSLNNKYIRNQSFRLWAASANENHLGLLKSIKLENEILYSEAIIKRAELNDYTVLEDIKKMITNDNHNCSRLIYYLSFIWDTKTFEFVDSLIKQYKNKINNDFSDTNSWIVSTIAKLMYYIPAKDVALLFEKHWDKLKYESCFILAAILTDTECCRHLVEESIKLHHKPTEIFKYLSLSLHGEVIGSTHFNRSTLTAVQLENIKPYFKYLNTRDIKELARLAHQQNLDNWIKKNMVQYFDNKENHYFELKDIFPTDEQLEIEFIKFTRDKQRFWQLDGWIDDLSKRECNKDRLMNLIEEWLVKYDFYFELYNCAAKCISKLGERNDIKLLEKIAGNEKISNLIANTKYRLYRQTLK